MVPGAARKPVVLSPRTEKPADGLHHVARPNSVPKLTHHKARGRGVVRLSGKDHYACRSGEGPASQREPPAAAKAEYNRLIAEWLANGRRPLGTSAVARPGSDVTVVSVSRMVHEAIAAAERVADDGLSVEVIDLRTVAPLDVAPILDSVHKTSRLLIAHEAVVPFGIGAEIAATVAREAFWDLDAPIQRIGAAATPPPYSPDLERAWLPDRDDIAEAIRRLTAM